MKVILHITLWKYITDVNVDYFTLLSNENPSINGNTQTQKPQNP